MSYLVANPEDRFSRDEAHIREGEFTRPSPSKACKSEWDSNPRGCSDKRPNEPPRDKTNKMACAPSKDSDQPGHPPSLIRVFAVRVKKAQDLSYPLSAQRRL